MNNIDLINKAKNGSKEALIALIREIQPNIYSTLYYMSNNSDETSDIAQNVLIKLSKNISKLKNSHNFKTWLNQIVINSYYDYLRKKQNKFQFLSLSDSNLSSDSDIADDKQNPMDSVLYSELDYVIKNSIQNLPIRYKIPITLREIQGLSYDNISKITNTSIGTVKSRIARARVMIKDKIKKYNRG